MHHLRPSSNVDFIRQIELNLPCIRDLREQRVCSVKTEIVSELEPQKEPVFSYRLPKDSSKRVAHGSSEQHLRSCKETAEFFADRRNV